MKYDSQKRKVQQSDENENKNQHAAENLTKIDLVGKPENVSKQIRVIHLIKGYNFTFGTVSTPFDKRVIVIAGGPDSIGVGGSVSA